MQASAWRRWGFMLGYGIGAGFLVVVGMFVLVGLWRPLLEPWPTGVRIRGLLCALAASAFLVGALIGRLRSGLRRLVFVTAGGTVLTLFLLLRATAPPQNATALVAYRMPGMLIALAGLLAGTTVTVWLRPRLTAERVALLSAGVVAAVWGLVWGLDGGDFKIWLWNLLPTVFPMVGILFGVLAWRTPTQYTKAARAIRAIALVPPLLLSAPFAWTMGVGRMAYPAAIEALHPHAWVRLPADEPLTVVWGGDTLEANYHAPSADQRWAYDLVIAPFFVGVAALDAYGCWGAPVLAPADGVVVAAHDGEPDHPAGQFPATDEIRNETVFGNHVVLQLAETGTFLVLAHLQAGSLRVQVGETVHEGEPLAACGNSGHSSEPHIHIHHQRQPPWERPVGFAEGLPLFFRDHDGPPMPSGGVRHVEGRWVAVGATVRHAGRAP